MAGPCEPWATFAGSRRGPASPGKDRASRDSQSPGPTWVCVFQTRGRPFPAGGFVPARPLRTNRVERAEETSRPTARPFHSRWGDRGRQGQHCRALGESGWWAHSAKGRPLSPKEGTGRAHWRPRPPLAEREGEAAGSLSRHARSRPPHRPSSRFWQRRWGRGFRRQPWVPGTEQRRVCRGHSAGAGAPPWGPVGL